MFGSQILEIGIGLIFIYLLLSLIVTALNEFFVRAFALRSKTLKQGLKSLIGDFDKPASAEGYVEAPEVHVNNFFNTPIIKSLTDPDGKNPSPSYLPSKRFFQGLVQMYTAGKTIGFDSKENIEEFINTLPKGDLRNNLLLLLQEAGDDVEMFQEGIENWFDDTMDRATGWFKRKTHTLSLCLAFAISIIFNASTINVAETLWNDEVKRAAVTSIASSYIEENSLKASDDAKAIEEGEEASRIISASLTGVVGWEGVTTDTISDFGWWLSHGFGWILTAFALSLGAPFWFDLLKRLVNLRTAGIPPKSDR